jgi:hypothetical protein
MTRRVFSNAMVAHVWAQQEQDSGRSGNGNFHFNGRTLWSYREPIARFTQSVDGGPVVLITSDSFSVTTSRHVSYAQSAIRGQTVFHVPDTGYDSREPDHAYNLRHLVKHAREPLGKVARVPFDSWQARPVVLADNWADWTCSSDAAPDAAETVPLFLAYAAAGFRIAAEYAATFDLPADLDGPAELAAAVAAWRARWAKFNTPEAARKRERAAAYRQRAKERKEEQERARQLASMQRRYVEWKTGAIGFHSRPQSWQFPPGSPERADLSEIETAEAEQAAREAREAFDLWQAGLAPRPIYWRYAARSPERAAIEADESRERIEREAEKRAAWLRGESVHYGGRDETGGAYIRARNVERDPADSITGGVLETSLDAEVPLPHAVRVFRFCRHVWAELGKWERNGQTVRVGHFQVDMVDATGMRAGCHWISRAEIERLAAELGIAGLEPSAAAVEIRPVIAAE